MASWFRPRSLLQLQEKKESIPMLHNLTSVQPPGQGVGVSLVNGGMVILEASIGRRRPAIVSNVGLDEQGIGQINRHNAMQVVAC